MQDAVFNLPKSQRSSLVLVERRAFGRDLAGSPFSVYEHTIPQGTSPIAGSFGLFEPYVYNERNSTQSRLRFISIDVNASAITFQYKTLDDGTVVRQDREIVPVGTALPASSLNRLNATRERLDENHEILVHDVLQDFPIVSDVEQASERYAGLDIRVENQRVEVPFQVYPSPTVANKLYSISSYAVGLGLKVSVSRTEDPGNVYVVQIDPDNPVGIPTLVGNTVYLPASYSVDNFWDAVAFSLNSIYLPGIVNFNYNTPGTPSSVELTHSQAGTSYGFTFKLERYTAPGTTETLIALDTVTGTQGPPSDSFVGPESTAGFTGQGETDKRLKSKKVSVVTPPGPEQITMRDWIPSLQAEQVFRKIEVVGTNENPNATHLDVAIQDKKISFGKKLRTRFRVNSWVDFVDYQTDPDTQEAVVITKSIKAVSGYVFTPEARVEVSARQIDHLRMEETRRVISSNIFGKSYRTTRNIQYKFPAWLVPGTEYHIYDYWRYSGQVIDYIAGLNEKAGQVLTVPAEVYTSYHPTKPIAPDVFQFYTTSFTARVDNTPWRDLTATVAADKDAYALTRKEPVALNDVITNSAPIVWRAQSSTTGFVMHLLTRTNPTWLDAVFGVAFIRTKVLDLPESKPNASVYVQMMLEGTLVLVGVEIEQWKYNLWKQTRTYIKIPNLITPGLAGL